MKVILPLLGIWAIWLGIMRLAEQSGLVQLLAGALRPVMRRLFPEVPDGHPAMGAMVMNMAANMLGLGNAATPLGLRAMRLLESLNPRPGVATNAMVTFLAINTASIQILPLTAIWHPRHGGGERRNRDHDHGVFCVCLRGHSRCVCIQGAGETADVSRGQPGGCSGRSEGGRSHCYRSP
jgi:spore maturation protein SpmA